MTGPTTRASSSGVYSPSASQNAIASGAEAIASSRPRRTAAPRPAPPGMVTTWAPAARAASPVPSVEPSSTTRQRTVRPATVRGTRETTDAMVVDLVVCREEEDDPAGRRALPVDRPVDRSLGRARDAAPGGRRQAQVHGEESMAMLTK